MRPNDREERLHWQLQPFARRPADGVEQGRSIGDRDDVVGEHVGTVDHREPLYVHEVGLQARGSASISALRAPNRPAAASS